MATPQKGVDIEAMFRSLQEQIAKSTEQIQKSNEETRAEFEAELVKTNEQIQKDSEESRAEFKEFKRN